MAGRLKRLFESTSWRAFVDALSLFGGLSIVVPLLLLLVAAAWPIFKLVGVVALAGYLIALVAAALAIFFWARRRRAYPRSWDHSDFEHLKESITYETNPATRSYALEMEFHVRALRDGVHLFEDRYQWSGKGTEGLPVVRSQGHQIAGQPIRRDIWSYYWISLGRNLTKNEERTIRVRQVFTDTDGTAEPFFSKTVTRPTRKLVLEVQFPDSIERYDISVDITRDSDPQNPLPIATDPKSVEKSQKRVRWVIDSPTLDHRYRLGWTIRN